MQIILYIMDKQQGPTEQYRHQFTLASVLPQASLGSHLVKNMPATQETLVQFLGQEDPLEKG